MCLFLPICFHCICETFLLPICVVASATINRFLFTKNECSIHNSIMRHVINNKGICFFASIDHFLKGHNVGVVELRGRAMRAMNFKGPINNN